MKASMTSALHARTRVPGSRTEWFLNAIGADPSFADDVLGDLAEERSRRAEVYGARSAHFWYVREALRSAPHLLASAVRRASWSGRARMATTVSVLALVSTIAFVAYSHRAGEPARLVADAGRVGDGIVVNNVKPVRITMRVLDARGRVLPDTGVRFAWTSGVPVAISSDGVITCDRNGDASVSASLGAAMTHLLLRCRPVAEVSAQRMMNVVRGSIEPELAFLALGTDGQLVSMLRGHVSVADTSLVSVVTDESGRRRLRGNAAGSTGLTIGIGDRDAYMSVHVYDAASTFVGMTQGQHLAVPVTLLGGQMRRWRLPRSRQVYFVTMVGAADVRLPMLKIENANCVASPSPHGFMCAAPEGAWVIAYYPRDGNQVEEVRGAVAVWRQPGWN